MASNSNYGIEGKWYTSADIEDLEDAYLGDRLEFNRGMYAHWGIYVGRYRDMQHAVIHFGIFDEEEKYIKKKISGSESIAGQKPEIRADTIEKILGDARVRINNSRDKKEQPLDPQVISEKAKTIHREKTPIEYNLAFNNCEHFVNLCRYNHPTSEQVTEAVKTVGKGLIWSFTPLPARPFVAAVMNPNTQR